MRTLSTRVLLASVVSVLGFGLLSAPAANAASVTGPVTGAVHCCR
jgi:hypothetical protein